MFASQESDVFPPSVHLLQSAMPSGLHAKLVLEDHLLRFHLDKEGVAFNSYALCEGNLLNRCGG
jgi:hypothetical protein